MDIEHTDWMGWFNDPENFAVHELGGRWLRPYWHCRHPNPTIGMIVASWAFDYRKKWSE